MNPVIGRVTFGPKNELPIRPPDKPIDTPPVDQPALKQIINELKLLGCSLECRNLTFHAKRLNELIEKLEQLKG